jgi:hypothetical protein
MNGESEFQAIDAAGHLDIGEQQFDVGTGFEDRQRVIGIDGFNRRKSGVLDHVDRAHAQHHFVFNNKNGAESGRLTGNHDAQHFHLEPRKLARASAH